MPPLRLAILEADTPVPAANEKYGGYFGVFKHLFSRAVSPAHLESELTLTGHDVVHNPDSAYPSLDDVDAILITGSKFNAFDDDAWILTLVEFVRKALVHERVRVVGICFGHQIVARVMGTLVARSDQGWELSVTETRLTERGKELFPGRETLVSSCRVIFSSTVSISFALLLPLLRVYFTCIFVSVFPSFESVLLAPQSPFTYTAYPFNLDLKTRP
jgi:hypothetical protein